MPDRELLSAEPLDETPEEKTPAGYLSVTLSDQQRGDLEAWLKNHLEQIEAALADVHGRFEEEVNQFEGLMPGGDYPYPGAFRVNVPLTKKKVREIANRLKQAYLDSDPIWAIVSPTLDMDTVSAVERGMDHQVDNELEITDDVSQAIFESVLHGVGALDPCWAYHEDIRRDVVSYAAFDGVSAASLADLFRFEQDYPAWRENDQTRKIHSQLAHGRGFRGEVSYRTPTVNRPDAVHIPAKDLRCYPHLNSPTDLQCSPVYGYVKTYTRQELEDFAADGTIDEDVLGHVFGTDSKDASPREAMEDYEVARLTIRYRLKGEIARYKVWFERKSNTVLRMRGFPWWLDKADLILFHTRQEEPGIFKRGIAWDLRDTHTAANVTFSLYLNGADMANSLRIKAKSGSLAEAHILNRRWSPHLTLPWKTDPNEVEPMPMSTTHLGPLVQGFELMRRQSDEETQTSSLQSGRESPTDPDAPGNKTAMLLAQVEPNMKEYIRSLETGFRSLGEWILMMLYQAKRLGWIDEIPGFPEIPDEEIPEIAKQLQPRALLFEFDRNSRLQSNMVAVNMISKFAPQAMPQALRIALSQINSQWSRLVDTLPLEAPPTPPTTPTAASAAGSSSGGSSRLQGLVPSNGAPVNLQRDLQGMLG